MSGVAPRFRFGPFVLRETVHEASVPATLACDAALFTPSWEARADAWRAAVSLTCPRLAYLNFALDDVNAAVLSAQLSKAKASGAVAIPLRSSVDVEINRKTLLDRLRTWSTEGADALFIDITSLPKAYIQSLICSVFSEGLFARLTLGYAEGRYVPPSDDEAMETAIDFGSANIMSGGVSPCREKHLITVLGGERANCYALIERIAPDTLRVLATRSAAHPEQADGIKTQVEKLKTVYADRLAEVREVDAFSIQSFLEAVDPARLRAETSATTSIFAAGTKPHAVASAILASSISGLDLRYRRVKAYAPTPVEWAGRYFLYEVLDLRSPALARCQPW